MAHQLANVLFLTAQRAVRFYLTRLQHCAAQVLFQRNCSEVLRFQGNQCLAEFLQRQVLAFPRTFAGLYFRHWLQYSPPIELNPVTAV